MLDALFEVPSLFENEVHGRCVASARMRDILKSWRVAVRLGQMTGQMTLD